MVRYHGGGTHAAARTTDIQDNQSSRIVEPADSRRPPTPPQRAASNAGETRSQVIESDTGRARSAAGIAEQGVGRIDLLDEAAGGTPPDNNSPPSYHDSQISATAAGTTSQLLRQYGPSLFRE